MEIGKFSYRQLVDQRKIRKYLELKANENITYQNVWDAAKVILREKFVAVHYELSNLFKKLGKE